MRELTLYFEFCDWIGLDLREYLLSLKGIIDTKIDTKSNYVYVKFDDSKTTYEIVKYEILIYTHNYKMPSIVGFNKHTKNVEHYTIKIADICCEFCFKGIIDDLLMTKGINSAKSDFDYDNMFDVNIDITFDKNDISKNEVLKLENRLNMQY